ncbi:MAG: FG-GAP repeat domain-containing protein [Planctomycetaceae bacterium]
MPARFRFACIGVAVIVACTLAGYQLRGADASSSPAAAFEERLIADDYSYAFGLSAADIDGDGDLDLTSGDVKGKPSLSKLFWYENDGQGTFARHLVHENEAGWFERHTTGDINGDGKPDIAIVNNRDGQITWYANSDDPKSGLWKRYVITTNCPRAYDVVLADIDADGDLDASAAGYASSLITWFENPGSDGWDNEWKRYILDDKMSEARTVAVVDMNFDGKPDILAASVGAENVPPDVTDVKNHASYLAWYENPADPKADAWTKHIIDDRGRAQIQGHPADVDDDGDTDVVIAQGMRDPLLPQELHTIVWYENVGERGMGTEWKKHAVGPMPYAFEAIASDFDGDGDTDIAATSWAKGDRVVWFENQGDPKGTWTTHLIKEQWFAANQIIAADFDGDGRIDLAATADDGSSRVSGALELRWWKNTGKP